MSEKFNPEVDQAIDQNVEDDPLAELARIVAGEPEPSHEVVAPDLDEPATETFEASSEPAMSDIDMEAALAAALNETSPGTEDMRGSIDQEPEISAREEISRAVDQVINEEPIEYGEPDPVSEASAQQSLAPEPAAAMSFEDDLITALESELVPSQPEVQPEPVPLVEEFLEIQEPVQELANNDAASTPEFASLENALAAELQEELAPEPTEDVEFNAPIEESFAPEPVLEVPVLENELAPEQPVAAEEPVALNEDLGAAFANEFEQMLSEGNPNAGESSELSVDASQTVEAFADNLVAPAEPQPVVEEPRSLDDLDFGSAFADELGIDKVEEVSGWETGGTEAAQADFSDALQPQTGISPVGYHDPGHSGEIPEVPNEAIIQAEATPEQGSGGSSPKYALAALIIAIFAGVIFAGYGFLGGEGAGVDGEPALIKADTDPIKEKPEDPGGRIVANQDKASYERVEGNDGDTLQQESLISKTEEPAEIVSTGVNDGTVAETNLAPKTDDRLEGSQEETQQNGTTLSGEVTPRVVQTVTVKPDGTIVTTTPSVPKIAETVASNTTELASNAVTSVSEATTNLTDTLRIEPKPVATEVITKPEPIDGARTTGDTAIPVASPLPKPVVKQTPKPVQTAAVKPAQPAASAAVRRSEWVVQVSSQRTPEAAQSSFTNLRNRFGVLQGRPMSVQRATVNGSTFYRVRVQTSSKSDANQLCNSLKSAGGSCFVTR